MMSQEVRSREEIGAGQRSCHHGDQPLSGPGTCTWLVKRCPAGRAENRGRPQQQCLRLRASDHTVAVRARPRPRLLSLGINQSTDSLVPLQCLKGRTEKLLTLYSADTPLSVSRSELQGNWPVTLYTFTEKLGDNGTEL